MHTEPFVRLTPVFKDYLWGGTTLKTLYGAQGKRVAEAWLLSVHPDGPSVIAEGPHQGQTLSAFLRESGQADALPILIKLIDSAQKLSVQVHPDDTYARVHENDHGKTEMWIILQSKPDAYLYVGFQKTVTKDEVRRRVADGTIEEVLRKIPTHAGDMVFIPAGTVHAIGEGNLICEVQQSSNATYRLYDYQRRGDDGQLRPLHLDKALDVADLTGYTEDGGPAIENQYFKVAQQTVQGRNSLPMDGQAFASVICVAGEGTLTRGGQTAALTRGDSLYLPPAGGDAQIEGNVRIVISYANP